MVTEKRLATIPDVDSLKRLCQSLAMLDAIMSPEWEYRYFSFNSKWDDGEMMASMRNGSGDEYFILFNSEGAIIKGFEHESSMSPWATDPTQVWPGVLDEVAAECAAFLTEPAFSMKDTTFCLWRRNQDPSWHVGDIKYPDEADPDGSEYLLFILDGDPKTYQQFAEEYYERAVDLGTVVSIYAQLPLTSQMIQRLNAEVILEDLKADLDEIDYPHC